MKPSGRDFVSDSDPFHVREARRTDSEGLIRLIDTVYREYGDKICLEGYDADLLEVPESYSNEGGLIVVIEHENNIVGSHACLPVDVDSGLFTFRRLYVDARYRGGTPVGHLLMQWAIDYAISRGAKRIEFWSDTRFARAHRFFEKFGFQKTGEVREMHDSWEPYSEFFYFKNL